MLLPVTKYDDEKWSGLTQSLENLGIPKYICDRFVLVSDRLFSHIVNSNLEVRTSVAIDPATGSAEEGALFTYEALPRGTVLIWEITCRNPKHFKINGKDIAAVKSPEDVRGVAACANCYLKHLGIGGMGSRGMGRLRVLEMKESVDGDKSGKEVS